MVLLRTESIRLRVLLCELLSLFGPGLLNLMVEGGPQGHPGGNSCGCPHWGERGASLGSSLWDT